MIKRILVAVDGSEHSGKAVDLAASLASQYEAETILVHVMSDGRLPKGLRRFAEAEEMDEPKEVVQYRMLGEKVMKEAEARAHRDGIAKITPVVAFGDAAEQIVATAKEHDADMIVMGTRGLSDIQGLLMGSVSHKVSHLAPCTCVTVK